MVSDIFLFCFAGSLLFLIECEFITSVSVLIYFKCAKAAERRIDVRNEKFNLSDNYVICALVALIPIPAAFYSPTAAAVYAVFHGLLAGILFLYVPKYFSKIRTVKKAEDKKPARLVFTTRKLNVLFSPCALKRYYDTVVHIPYVLMVLFIAAKIMRY